VRLGGGANGRLSQRARVGSDKPASVNRREGPAFTVSYRPGEWQTYDIRLIGRDVTIVLNGKALIDRKRVKGLTAIASDPNEAEPGPIVVQGDHGSVGVPQVHIDAARDG
jgi:hypothetical protein